MVETIAHRSILWSPDSCHSSGRYCDSEAANGFTLIKTIKSHLSNLLHTTYSESIRSSIGDHELFHDI